MIKVKMTIDLVTETENSPAQNVAKMVGIDSLEDVVQAVGRIEWRLWMTGRAGFCSLGKTTSKFSTHRYRFSLNIFP
jgi:allophanate hydrolase subunit 1